jgi:hypothetical protein
VVYVYFSICIYPVAAEMTISRWATVGQATIDFLDSLEMESPSTSSTTTTVATSPAPAGGPTPKTATQLCEERKKAKQDERVASFKV